MEKMCQMTLSREAAETVAMQALAWLAGNDELLPVYLGATGASEMDLRARVAEPEFLLSVLDFLMMDDAWVIAFCDVQSKPSMLLLRVTLSSISAKTVKGKIMAEKDCNLVERGSKLDSELLRKIDKIRCKIIFCINLFNTFR